MALSKSGLQFVLTLLKRPENASTAKTFRHIYLCHFFFQDSKTHSRSVIPRHCTAKKQLKFALEFYLYNVFTSGQEEFLERAR